MENKFKKIWVHEAYKNVGTSNWTVREQDEKPPKPTAYESDWNDYVPASALESANAEKSKYKEMYEDYSAEVEELQHKRNKLEAENKKLADENERMRNELRDKLAGNFLQYENKNLADKLSDAVKIINKMQHAIKYNMDKWDALNIGAKFNSNNPDLFNSYLKSNEEL